MFEPPVPPDESARQAALDATGLVDTADEERFDRITRTAARLFDVPIALVSLIDVNRQWFKSCIGLPVRETSRGISFCGHAILSDDALVIPDASKDRRFADNPLVTSEPNIRFYAGQPLHAVSGHRLGTLCIIDRAPREFTDRDLTTLADLGRWAELELQASETTEAALARWIRRLVQHAADGIVVIDQQGRVQFANPAAVRLVGFDPDLAEGLSVFDVIVEEDRARALEALGGTLAAPGAAEPLELRIRRPDGEEVWVEVIATNEIDDPAVGGVVLNVRDVAARVERDRLRRDFLSLMSHEIRTPLTAIGGMLHLLGNGAVGELPEAALELVDVAARNTTRVVELATDILETERIEGGRLELDLAPASLRQVVELATSSVSALARGADVAIRADVDDVVANVDAGRIVQVLTNLLSNAVKFSDPGSVVRLTAGSHDTGIRIRVTDEGRGIPPEHIDRVFDRYAQVEVGDAARHAGSGLGLSIVKGIVDQHGGQVRVSSVLGEGTTFEVDLPR